MEEVRIKNRKKTGLLSMFLSGVLLTLLVMLPLCKKEGSMHSTDYVMPDSIWFQSKNFSTRLDTDGSRLADVHLRGEQGIVNLYSLLDKPVLVFRYFDRNCESCIEKEAAIIKECVENPGSKVLMIGSFSDYRSMKAYNQAHGIEGNTLQINLNEKLDWKPDTYELPYYFILYPDGRVSHFFMAMPEYATYTRKYLERMNCLLSPL